jgi:ABC-type transporter Mla MlaB component
LRLCRFVECWIGVVDESDRRIVRLAGRLGEAQVPELLMACSEAARLELDLSDLLSADVAGLEALQRVQARGATFVGVPGYIQLQLGAPSRIRKRGRGGKA